MKPSSTDAGIESKSNASPTPANRLSVVWTPRRMRSRGSWWALLRRSGTTVVVYSGAGGVARFAPRSSQWMKSSAPRNSVGWLPIRARSADSSCRVRQRADGRVTEDLKIGVRPPAEQHREDRDRARPQRRGRWALGEQTERLAAEDDRDDRGEDRHRLRRRIGAAQRVDAVQRGGDTEHDRQHRLAADDRPDQAGDECRERDEAGDPGRRPDGDVEAEVEARPDSQGLTRGQGTREVAEHVRRLAVVAGSGERDQPRDLGSDENSEDDERDRRHAPVGGTRQLRGARHCRPAVSTTVQMTSVPPIQARPG